VGAKEWNDVVLVAPEIECGASSKSRGDSVQEELLRHVGIILEGGEGREPIGGVLWSILLPSIAVIVGGSSRSLGRPVLKLNMIAAFRCVRRLSGGDTSCVSGGIALQTHAICVDVGEIVSVPVTVFV
jgi:hypothetical protein